MYIWYTCNYLVRIPCVGAVELFLGQHVWRRIVNEEKGLVCCVSKAECCVPSLCRKVDAVLCLQQTPRNKQRVQPLQSQAWRGLRA